MKKVKAICLAALVSLMPAVSFAAAIVVGNHLLFPNKPNQTITIMVTGGEEVQGLNLYAQIADGGPSAGGLISGPAISAMDILQGTIFASNNTGVRDPGSLPQVAARTTTTDAGTVSAKGVLATLTIDTTGYTSGSWALNLEDTLNGPTDFAGLPINITDGSIELSSEIPEPACLGSVLMFLSLLICKR